MGLTFQLDPTFYGDFTPANLQSRSLHLVSGYFSYDSASSTAMTITADLTGLNRLLGFIAMPKGNIFWQTVPGTDFSIQAIQNTVSSISATYDVFMATASSVIGSVTSIPFLAWGYR